VDAKPSTTAAGEHNGRLLLEPKQAAELLAVSARTLWQLTEDGKVLAVRIGRLVRYVPQDLAAYVSALRAEALAARDAAG
jgi:excisionase family DNA binding protein